MFLIISRTLALAAITQALPQPQFSSTQSLNGSRVSDGNYTLPASEPNPAARAAELTRNRAGYQYGPSKIGNSSFFLSGPLGDQLVQTEIADWNKSAASIQAGVQTDASLALQNLVAAGGITNLSSYEYLYNDQWKTSNPEGVDTGVLSNYTQDLLFSMERLSNNPFPIRRLHPQNDILPFEIDDETMNKLTNTSLESLHAAGRLFIVDHSYQANYSGINGRFTAACTAYFFIDPTSQDLLPLAIKTNVGNDLIYTPLDDSQDWLLAKIMFNVNDVFYGQILHLANSHAVAEIVHEAALRTMSASHPVRGYFDYSKSLSLHQALDFPDRFAIMYQAYAIRPVGERVLFNTGGLFDQNFALSSVAVRQFEADFYPTVAGPFQANYFLRSLTDRGLINCSYGPELAHFPFAEDAGAIVNSLQEFATSFVEAYYSNESMILSDPELQAWVSEASGAAQVIDFPASPMMNRQTLIDVLTHLAYLTGVNHHTLNSGTLAASSAVLPFHPFALYQPIPETKGVGSVFPFLPNLTASLNQVALVAGFIRPQWINSEGDLQSVFEGSDFLAGVAAGVKEAATRLSDRLTSLSNEIQARSFDENGLAQGMPFIWKNLDPRRIPFFLYV